MLGKGADTRSEGDTRPGGRVIGAWVASSVGYYGSAKVENGGGNRDWWGKKTAPCSGEFGRKYIKIPSE